MTGGFDFEPLISAKLLQLDVSTNPKGHFKGTCSYDVSMVWDNGIHLMLRADNEWSVEMLQKAIGLKIVGYGPILPNHAAMNVTWLFENGYNCTFNVLGWIQWS